LLSDIIKTFQKKKKKKHFHTTILLFINKYNFLY